MNKTLSAVMLALLIAGTALPGAMTPLEGQGGGGSNARPGPLEGEALLSALDEIFRGWSQADSPGCAVGIEAPATPDPIRRAWGMAELEHAIPNTAATIFEAGSVSKQFTTAAIVLLELDGVLSRDDDVRRWIPELPDYGTPITLRHMITHTSGLRDWGSVAAIGGWGRGDRTHTHAHVLEIAARQRALNFEPGAEYSYSNTGYNLLAIIVERASGQSFAAFSRTRIFEPLGLSNTQWRDDYRRIVPGRSSAYTRRGGGWAIDRPIEDVHGNGGLLTTVDDLLRWNRVLADAAEDGPLARPLGGKAFSDRMLEQGVLLSGETITYAGGLFVETLLGHRAITHTGATAGYRAYLGQLPEQKTSIAILCNASDANPGVLGRRVAELVVASAPSAPATTAPSAPAADPASAAAAASAASTASAAPPAAAERLSPAALNAYTGRWISDEAETVWRVEREVDGLILIRSPGIRSPLQLTGPDTFQSPMGTLRFYRNDQGEVVEFGISQARVYDLRFVRDHP